MTRESTIQSVVMRRVHTVHTLRLLSSTPIVAGLVFAVALWGIGREVWVARVFENMPSLTHADALARFTVSAFANTEVVVQALSVLALVALVWMIREIARMLVVPRFA